MHLKQSTASQAVVIGPFVDDGDGVTPMTALTIDAADIRISKNGANIVGKNSGGGTHDEIGYYTITLDATDTNTVGRLQIMVNKSGALPVYHEFEVLEEAVYDMLYGASALGYIANAPVNVAQVSGDATAADTLELFAEALDQATGQLDSGTLASGTITSASIAGDAITAAKVAADVTTEIQSGLATAANLATVAGYLDTEIAAILADTNELQTDWVDGGRLDLILDAILDDTDLIDDGTSGLAKIATDAAAILVDTSTTLQNELDGIQADTEDIQSRLPAALVGGRIDATVDATGMESGAVDAIWDEVLEGSYTGRQLMRAFAAVLAGKVSGAGTTTITFRNTGDSKDVITATVDVNGNRSEVTLDLT